MTLTTPNKTRQELEGAEWSIRKEAEKAARRATLAAQGQEKALRKERQDAIREARKGAEDAEETPQEAAARREAAEQEHKDTQAWAATLVVRKSLDAERRAAKRDLEDAAKGSAAAEQGFLGGSAVGFADQLSAGGQANTSEKDQEQLNDLFESFTPDMQGTGDRMSEELRGVLGDPGDVDPPSAERVASEMKASSKAGRTAHQGDGRNAGAAKGSARPDLPATARGRSGHTPRGRRQNRMRPPAEIRRFGKAARGKR